MSATVLDAQARATARAARGCPTASATSEYDRTLTAVGNLPQIIPDLHLERRRTNVEWQLKARFAALQMPL